MSTAVSEPLQPLCESRGMSFKRIGGELYAKCPFHNDGGKPNFRINPDKNSWFCDVCGKGGGPVEFVAALDNRPRKDVWREMSGNDKPDPGQPVATYDYRDRFGNLVYQVCRFVPKTFRQRKPDGKGGWIWKMDGVERVLYHLPEVLDPKNQFIFIVEGEKDVETLRDAGYKATCNVGGAGKWLDPYSECLKDKYAIVCGDNDDPGKAHVEAVIKSVENYAIETRRITLPPEFKDVSDFRASFSDKKAFRDALAPLVDAAQVFKRGANLPIQSISDLEQEYIESVKNAETAQVKLSDWLPSLRCVRPLVGGELVTLMGDTGSSKTYCLQHIAMHCRVPTLLFELELPGSLTFERFVSIAQKKDGDDVFRTYRDGKREQYGALSHVYTCTKSRISPEQVESLINKAELKMGARPALVLVDYIQLVQSVGRSRYEKVSNVAEEMKIVAKNTNTVIVLASQVGRDRERAEITLHDAKESGSIENSSGVVIGIWRDEENREVLKMRVLKNTKGRPSDVIECLIQDGMRIVEMDTTNWPA